MWFSSWLRNGKPSAPAARCRTQKSPRRRAGFRPRFESLEDRNLFSGSGLPYPTAATADQLAADISYADNTGGAFTVNLQPGTGFGGGIIGGAKAVDLTILGNGDSVGGFNVALGSSLTLDHVTVEGLSNNGSVFNSDFRHGGAIYNQGTLTVSDSTLSGNSVTVGDGGAIYNAGGTVIVSNSTLSGNNVDGGSGGAIYNAGGSLTLDNSTLSGNWVTVEDYGGGFGGAIYNAGGTVTVQHSSSITGNYIFGYEFGESDVENGGVLYQDSTSTIGALYGLPAIPLDPNAPQLQIRDVAVTEGNTGTVAANFTVTLSAASTQTITVAYATANGTATAGSDYQAASGTLTFAPGETSKTVTAVVNGDRLAEPNETFFINLSAATNATITIGQGTGTIVDDEPRISITDVSKQEGKKGQTTLFTFTVTLSAAYDQAVTMSYRTLDGTAKSGSDYVAKSGTLTFAPGETTKTITIAVKGDNTKEPDETFYLDLFGNSSNSLFTKSRGIGTILNDD